MKTLPVIENVPTMLRARNQWVVWRYETRDKNGKPTKVPYQAAHPQRKASSKAPHTWASFDQSLATMDKYHFDGVGYVFSADDPFVGFDFDDVLDDQGQLCDWAQPWMDTLTTYVEVSPSGHGIKGIAIGKLPGGGINAGTVELYDQGRYFAITAQRYDHFPAEPQPLNGAIDRLYAFAQQEKDRNDDLRERRRQEAYAQAALRNEADRVQNASDGTRNDTLNRAAFALSQFMSSGLLSEDAIVETLTAAGASAGLGASEIRSTLRSGIRAGSQETRTIPTNNSVTGEIVETRIAPPAKQAEGFTALSPVLAADLMMLDIPAPRQFVPGLIREGLSFFIGQPGVGKTPALVQLAIALSTGSKWMGTFQCPKVRTAYIGPEYDAGDIRGIILDSAGGNTHLDNLLVFTVENFTGPTDEADALNMIEYLANTLHVEALIIDLFTGFLPPEKFKPNAYRGDYREFLAYHRAALQHHMLLTGAWHGTKRDVNPATMYNGGQGFWGAAGGGRLVMFQDEEDQVKLYSQQRGSKAVTYTLTEARAHGRHTWAVLEGAESEPMFGSDVHRSIYRALKDHAGSQGLTPKTISGLVKPDLAMNVSEAYIRKSISVLVRRGILAPYGDGYVLAGTVKFKGSQGSQGSEGTQGSEGSRDRSFSDPSDPSSPYGGIAPTPDWNAQKQGSDPAIPPIPHFYTDPYDSHPIWSQVPRFKLTGLRLYLRSNKDSDQDRARTLCDEYGIDYDAARKAAQEPNQ